MLGWSFYPWRSLGFFRDSSRILQGLLVPEHVTNADRQQQACRPQIDHITSSSVQQHKTHYASIHVFAVNGHGSTSDFLCNVITEAAAAVLPKDLLCTQGCSWLTSAAALADICREPHQIQSKTNNLPPLSNPWNFDVQVSISVPVRGGQRVNITRFIPCGGEHRSVYVLHSCVGLYRKHSSVFLNNETFTSFSHASFL